MWPPAVDKDFTLGRNDAGKGMVQPVCRGAKQPAPVTRVMPAFTEIGFEVEVEASAIAQRNIGLGNVRPRPIGSEHGVRLEICTVFAQNFAQAL